MPDIAVTTTSAAARPTGAPAGLLIAGGARAALSAPVAAVFAIVVGAPLYADDLSAAAGTGRFTVAAAVTLVLFGLLALALLALHAAQEHRLGRAAHAGYGVALLGTLLAAGGQWDALFAVPYLAEHAPSVLDRGTDGSLLAGYVVSYLVFAVGWTSVAVTTLRAKVLPRGAAIVLLAGAVLAILPAPTPIRVLVLSAGGALLGRAALRR
jgi:hypothetical protein